MILRGNVGVARTDRVAVQLGVVHHHRLHIPIGNDGGLAHFVGRIEQRSLAAVQHAFHNHDHWNYNVVPAGHLIIADKFRARIPRDSLERRLHFHGRPMIEDERLASSVFHFGK